LITEGLKQRDLPRICTFPSGGKCSWKMCSYWESSGLTLLLKCI